MPVSQRENNMLKYDVVAGTPVEVIAFEKYPMRKPGDRGHVLETSNVHVRVKFSNGIESMRWDSLCEIVDFTLRIKACLEKRKARKPVFDRATWHPKIGDKVRVVVQEHSWHLPEGTVAAVFADDGTNTYPIALNNDLKSWYNTIALEPI